jgi:hypothetical protein
MLNETHTEGQEQVAQGLLETILKLANSGSPPEAICSFLGLKAQTVQQIIANDSMHRAGVVQSIKERSAEYRCTLSKRLMVCPVMDSYGNFYEQSILVADPSHSVNQFMPSKKLRALIEDFCKESLRVLEVYLRQRHPQEDILELTAECLSVLSPDAGLESALRVLGGVEGETVKKLLGKLRGLVPEEMLLSLMSQLARQLPSHALCLAALIILKPHSERALEEAFRCFAELLSQVALDAGSIDLAEEVSERLSCSQLSQINAALGARPSEGGDRLDGLRLKEAYALLREGKVEAAICLVNTLRISPRLESEVLRFFDEAGLSSGKVPILEQRLSAKLEEISRDSPSVAETLSVIHQLNAELHSQRSEATSQSLISLKAEVLNETLAKLEQQTSHALIAQEARIQRLEEQAQRKEPECQETVSSLRAKVEALTEELLKVGEEISQIKRAQDAQFQRHDEELNKAMLQSTPKQTQAVLPHTSYSPEETKHFFYSCKNNLLHRVNLLTGEQSEYEVPHYQFKGGCRWSELPGGSLLITGGGSSDVVRVDVGTFEVSPQPPMHTARSNHAAVYHSQYVYVLGGVDLSECERYVCAESRWEVLAALPVGGRAMSAVELHNSLYALGGYQGDRRLDTVQKLSLDSLTWQLMQLKLPQADNYFPCFKMDTEVCLVIKKTLYSFTPLEVKPIKTLPQYIKCTSSYYSRGTLYYEEGRGIGLTRL